MLQGGPAVFPLGTFTVNVVGSFLIGVVMTVLTERGFHQNWRFLLVVGFLGGYTTFSSFEYETYVATKGSDFFTAGSYVVTSVVLGFVALWVGAAIARK